MATLFSNYTSLLKLVSNSSESTICLLLVCFWVCFGFYEMGGEHHIVNSIVMDGTTKKLTGGGGGIGSLACPRFTFLRCCFYVVFNSICHQRIMRKFRSVPVRNDNSIHEQGLHIFFSFYTVSFSVLFVLFWFVCPAFHLPLFCCWSSFSAKYLGYNSGIKISIQILKLYLLQFCDPM